MDWYQYLAFFGGGAFFANGIPHLCNGLSGRPFQTPFAKPRGMGKSSSTLNVLWGFVNFLIAYLLLFRAAAFDIHDMRHVLVAGFGSLLMSLFSARHFGQFNGGR
jgi:hypothetical protein